MKRSRIRSVNRGRREVASARNYGAQHPLTGMTRADAIRAMPCLAAGRAGHRCRTRVQAAHVVPRRMGGCGGDRHHQAPLCADAHRDAGELPSPWMRADPERYRGTQRGAWEERHGIDLLAEARRIDEKLTAEGYP